MKKLFKMEDVNLSVEDDALDYIVTKALELKLGARGLRAILDVVFTDALFEMPSIKKFKTIVLTKAYAAV